LTGGIFFYYIYRYKNISGGQPVSEKTIFELADGFGLTVEAVSIPEHERAIRVFKGAKQQFVGTEEAVRHFLTEYGNNSPDLYAGSMYGYQE